MSNISSFIVPVKHKFNATSSLSNFGHNTPGVSSNSILSFIRIHCFCFVTPGLFPTPADVLFAILFMNDDFPTLGIPSIIALIFLPVLPFCACCSKSTCIIFSTSFMKLSIPFPEFESTNTAGIFLLLKYSTHSLFCFSSDRSHLFNTIIFFLFFVISAMFGF